MNNTRESQEIKKNEQLTSSSVGIELEDSSSWHIQIDTFRELASSMPYREEAKDINRELNEKINTDNLLILHNQFFYILDCTNLSIPFVHPNLSHVLGYHPDFFTDLKNIYASIHPDDRDFVLAFSKKALLYPRTRPKKEWFKLKANPNFMVFSIDFRMKKNDGNYMRVNRMSSCFNTDREGRMIYGISLYTDIDHIKKTDNITWNWAGDVEGKFSIDDICKKYLPHYFTKRETEIINLFSRGLTGSQIAEQLHISFNTVITHRKNMLKKAKVKNTTELIKVAFDHGILHEKS
jgi:DNA-binding CsgD family transcriptional regulator